MDLIVRIAEDDGLRFSKRIRGNRLSILRHCAGTETVTAWFASDVNCPSAQHHWNGPTSRNPFAVVFTDEMQMSTGFVSADTGWMPDVIITINPFSNRGTIGSGNVQINQIPTGLFESVSIQVFDHYSVFRADDETGRCSFDPCRGCGTTSMIAGWRKINGGHCTRGQPGTMRTICENSIQNGVRTEESTRVA